MKKLFFGVAALLAATAHAQLASDQVPHQRTLPLNEEVRKQLEASRWHFGPFRVQPAFAVRDFGYDNNVFGTQTDAVSDWRSTVSGGVRAVLPFGPKMYLRTDLVPEYTYYQKLTDRRTFGGTYGASVLGLFNRMTVQTGANVFKGLSPVSSELERAAIGRRTDVNGALEIEVLRRLSLFGYAQGERQRYSLTAEERVGGSSLNQLERNETVNRGGVRYRFLSFLDISAAAEKTRTNFLVDQTKNDETKAVIFGVHYDRPRTFLNVSVGNRTGEATDVVSRFARFSTTTGSYYASHELAARLLFDVYGHRGIGYSLTVENPYFLETRNGVGVTIPVGRRLAVRGFGESGTNKYPNPVQSINRVDDAKTYGGGFAFKLYRNIALVALGSQLRYTSNVPGNDRSIFRLTTSIAVQGGFFQ